MEIYFTGIIIAISTFLIIGLFHPLVIKVEYHTGTRYWWVFLVIGILSVGVALFIENALIPAKVVTVLVDEEDKEAKVVVPDYQLSLAIGKEG